MPSLTRNIQNIQNVGPVIEVVFNLTHSAIFALKAANQPLPTPIRALGMIDTGATMTTITPSMAAALGIIPINQIQMLTPSTPTAVLVNQYAVDVTFETGATVQNVAVAESSLSGQHIQCLIGRDILHHGVLIYIGYNNQFTLSF